jgi:hypothetical protein
MVARELTEQAVEKKELTYRLTTVQQASSRGGFSAGGMSAFFGVVFMLWIFSSMRRRPVSRRR